MDVAVAAVVTGLVALGLVVISVAVLGVVRLPDLYSRLHAASKAVFLGVIALLAAAAIARGGAIASRALLAAAFLVVSAPVSSHAIAWAAWRRDAARRAARR